MFSDITIKPSQNLLFDLGQIAESLLFYEKVNLVCGPSFFKNLIEYGEVDSFLELMSTGKIQVKLEDNTLGSWRKDLDGKNNIWLRPVLVQGQNVSLQDRLDRVIKETTKRAGYSRRLTKKILDNSEVLLHSNKLIEFVQQDLEDQVYLKRAISHSISNFDKSKIISPEEIQVKVHKIDQGFIIDTDIDFEKINKDVSIENQLKVDAFLFNIMNARIDSSIAGQMDSDLVTSPIITTLLKEKVNSVIQKSTNNLNQIDNFSDVFLNEGKRIRDVLNSGEKSLDEYMKILDKADKFKDWLKNIDEDKNLLSEYNKAVTADTWLDKLPSKSFRWVFFTGAGFAIDALGAGGIGTAAGLIISAGDTFLLDKMVKGWKPNTFVNNELGDFINKK
jgi:hypothetical protein